MEWKIMGRVVYFSKTVACIVCAGLCLLLVIGGYFFATQKEALSTEGVVVTPNPTAKPTATATPVQWQVYVVGAVHKPGVYVVEEGALVHDAIAAAGGLLQTVDAQTINMVQTLEPNLMVQILTEAERQSQGRNSSLVLVHNNQEESVVKDGKVNINVATKEELMTLAGIGEARAESIIAYRQEHGPFQAIEDIMLVNGIKESAFAKIKDRITT